VSPEQLSLCGEPARRGAGGIARRDRAEALAVEFDAHAGLRGPQARLGQQPGAVDGVGMRSEAHARPQLATTRRAAAGGRKRRSNTSPGAGARGSSKAVRSCAMARPMRASSTSPMPACATAGVSITVRSV